MGSRPKLSSGDRYFPQEDPETRQHYANVRIQELQRQFSAANEVLPLDVALLAFRSYGEFYDHGFRLRDVQQVAA